MGTMEVLDELINCYSNRDLNEADTRFKIIDKILKEVFYWPDSAIDNEKYSEAGFCDYLLYRNKRPILIIEAKKEGFYFNLPQNINTNALYRRIKIKELLTDENIRKAIKQVKDYCEELGVDYGCITNGHEWIFFHQNPQGKPWKELPAYVITNLSYFKDQYTTAQGIFNYYSVINKYSLNRFIGTDNIRQGELFCPKTSITGYDIPVTKNVYANVFDSISRRFLEDIPIDNPEFMKQCYVFNREYDEALQTGVNQFIYDSLTPYFKSHGYKELADTTREIFASRVTQIIKRENLNSVLILVGGRGSGKSTFIKRLLFHINPEPIKTFSVISLINLLNCTQIPNTLSEEIWDKLCQDLDKNKILESEKDKLLALFEDKYSILKKQLLVGLDSTSPEYIRLINNFIIENKNNIKYCCERLSHEHKVWQRGIIVVLDNMDQLTPDLQDLCFLTAKEIADKLSCVVVISMREERFFYARQRGVLDAYHNNGFHLSSPLITDVIQKRIKHILSQINTPSFLKECEINEDNKNIIETFLTICLNNLQEDKSSLNTFLSSTSHGDVRQALKYFSRFLTSGYTDVDEMSSDPSWIFAKHQVFKPMLVPERFFYDESVSDIPNLYQIRDEAKGSHFTALRILHYLDNKNSNKTNMGFFDVKYLIMLFDNKYNLKKDCELNLNILLAKGLIEASNRLESYSEDVDQIKITSFGKYMLRFLSKNFTYLDLICYDCSLYDQSLCNEFIITARIELDLFHEKRSLERINRRLSKVDKFINYLIAEEEKEVTEYSLEPTEKRFSQEIYSYYIREKQKVLKSAKNKFPNTSSL